MQLQLSDEEMFSIIKGSHQAQIIETVDQIIKYLRETEKQYQNGNSKVSGIEKLKEMLWEGIINVGLYVKLKETVEHPDTPYVIIMNPKSKDQ